jgi:hypothetical protein
MEAERNIKTEKGKPLPESEDRNTETEHAPSRISIRLTRYFLDKIKGVTPASKRKHQRKRYTREFYGKAKEEAWKRPIEAIGLILLFCYTSFAGYQSCELGESVTEQAKATKAAIAQASITDEAMRISNRPYVQIRSEQSATWILDDKGQQTGIDLYLENAGNTPAEETIVCGGIPNTGRPINCQHLQMRPKRVEMSVAGSQPKRVVTAYTSTIGPVIPARTITPIRIANITAEEIQKGLKDKTGFSVMGAFEYTNVFDEYCCEPFQIILGRTGFVTEPLAGYYVACAPDRPNVCQPKSQQQPTEK